MNEPRNINDARRLILREERARLILKEGYTFWPDAELDTVAVCKPGRLAADYWIDGGKCDCPDFEAHGDFCKHVLAYDMVMEEAAQVAEMDRRAEEEANAEYPLFMYR